MVTGNGRRVTSPERNWIENARAPPLQGNKPRQSCQGAAGCKSSRSVTANSQGQARIEPEHSQPQAWSIQEEYKGHTGGKPSTWGAIAPDKPLQSHPDATREPSRSARDGSGMPGERGQKTAI